VTCLNNFFRGKLFFDQLNFIGSLTGCIVVIIEMGGKITGMVTLHDLLRTQAFLLYHHLLS
jgi:hypothetical protein